VFIDTVGTELPSPAQKRIDLEGGIVKNAVLRDQLALSELVRFIREFRTIAESKPLTLQGLHTAIDRADGFLHN
jgi:hypothetical protein